MRHLSPETARMIEEHDRSMREIREARERWAREGRRPASGSNYGPRRAESAGTPWVRPTTSDTSVRSLTAPTVRPPLSKGTHGRVLPPARSSAPRYVCAICGTAAAVDAKWRCAPCAAEVAWRVKLATSGLKVVF